ncbi:MAG: hypothetical protein PWP23_212 [Candidatus Sumerlaeota bacterium]|nr:hypothetical protein [Candidatus Sumerlaeota bacterium]
MKTKRGAFGVARAMGLAAAVMLAAGVASAQLTHPFRVDGLDGTNGVRMNVREVFSETVLPQHLGHALSGIGDVNGDGFEDFAVSMYGRSVGVEVPPSQIRLVYRGKVHVVFGREQPWPQGNLSLGDLAPTDGFSVEGVFTVSNLGVSVSGAGDVNGDGYADFLVGAPGRGYGEEDSAIYLIFGRSDFPSPFELFPLNEKNAVRLYHNNGMGDFSGGIGDVNGDGFDDFYMAYSHPMADESNGEIVYGRPSGWVPEACVWLEFIAGTECTRIVNVLDGLQPAISGLGDVNGDGGYSGGNRLRDLRPSRRFRRNARSLHAQRQYRFPARWGERECLAWWECHFRGRRHG